MVIFASLWPRKHNQVTIMCHLHQHGDTVEVVFGMEISLWVLGQSKRNIYAFSYVVSPYMELSTLKKSVFGDFLLFPTGSFATEV